LSGAPRAGRGKQRISRHTDSSSTRASGPRGKERLAILGSMYPFIGHSPIGHWAEQPNTACPLDFTAQTTLMLHAQPCVITTHDHSSRIEELGKEVEVGISERVLFQ